MSCFTTAVTTAIISYIVYYKAVAHNTPVTVKESLPLLSKWSYLYNSLWRTSILRIWKKIEMKQYVILQCFTLLNHATTCTGVSFKGLQNSCHSIVKKGYPQQKSFQPMQFNKKANYSKMYNNKWQKSAILACCCQLVCLSHYCWWLITENSSNLPYNDVSHQYLFQLVEAGFHVLVVNSISSKDCGCWTFISLNVFGEMTSILAVF